MPTPDEERADAHAELALERWEAHREKHAAEHDLADQKWKGHGDQHEAIARNLSEYKAQSNEWRGSLSDLRVSFATRVELEAVDNKLTAFREELRALIATEREERRERTGQVRGAGAQWGYIVTAISAVAGLLVIIAVAANVLMR